MRVPIKECPRCGSTQGFYTRARVIYSYRHLYLMNGKRYDYPDNERVEERVSRGNYAICLECEQVLFRIEEDE